MNKGYKIAAAVLALGGAYLLVMYFARKGRKESDKPTETTGSSTGSTATSGSVDSRYPLKKGSKGTLVRNLQAWLLKIDPTSLPKYGADGDFGTETEKAVIKIFGKSTVEEADFARLQTIYNTKKFPMMFPNAPGNTTGAPKPLFLASF